jgi:hypothetical protein
MSLTLDEYREIIAWYAKTKYYEQKYGNAAPPVDRDFENRIHRKLRESVKHDEQEAQEEA